jgi:hypothetical protein
MVNIPMCYSNSTIVNMYWYCRKLVYEIIVNRGGYKITYFVGRYRVYSPYIYIYIYIYIYKFTLYIYTRIMPVCYNGNKIMSW